jgi:hypothetical protein
LVTSGEAGPAVCLAVAAAVGVTTTIIGVCVTDGVGVGRVIMYKPPKVRPQQITPTTRM